MSKATYVLEVCEMIIDEDGPDGWLAQGGKIKHIRTKLPRQPNIFVTHSDNRENCVFGLKDTNTQTLTMSVLYQQQNENLHAKIIGNNVRLCLSVMNSKEE